eukprot:m.105234 g.105234  ORF g.105234 m.105234 type:complete len:84 (-) comp9126_c0_seq2:665-916(-)
MAFIKYQSGTQAESESCRKRGGNGGASFSTGDNVCDETRFGVGRGGGKVDDGDTQVGEAEKDPILGGTDGGGLKVSSNSSTAS